MFCPQKVLELFHKQIVNFTNCMFYSWNVCFFAKIKSPIPQITALEMIEEGQWTGTDGPLQKQGIAYKKIFFMMKHAITHQNGT